MKKVSLILCTILLPFLYPAADQEIVELNSNEGLVVAQYMQRFNEDFATRKKISVDDAEEVRKFCCHNRGPRYRLPKSGLTTLARLEEISGYLYDGIDDEKMLLSSLKQLRSDYLERLSSENGKKSAKKQLGKGLQEYGRRNANSINRLILQCEKRISRFMTVKNSIDELSNSMRDSITAVIIWDYCAVDLSGELLIEFAKRLPVPEKGMLEMQIRARNLTALKASFMDHIQSVHGY